MREVAIGNPDVLEDPPPRVLFKAINDGSMSFDLICFVGEVDTSARVSSDLTFAVYRRLTAAGLGWPAPGPAKLELAGLDELRKEVADLRARLATTDPAEAEGSPGVKQQESGTADADAR